MEILLAIAIAEVTNAEPTPVPVEPAHTDGKTVHPDAKTDKTAQPDAKTDKTVQPDCI
jgi:hypothetical protein